MALRDEEQRELAEIERRLAADDPRLDYRLAKLRPFALTRSGLALVGVLGSFFVGLIAIATGSELASPLLAIVGALLAVGVPTAAVWRMWLRKL